MEVNNSEQNLQRPLVFTFTQRLKYATGGLVCIVVGLGWVAGCFGGLADELTGRTRHIPPFNVILELMMLGGIISGIGLVGLGILLIGRPRSALVRSALAFFLN